MSKYDLQLLDCTLRDGGYINNWEFGYETARDIVKQLTRANIDVVEVGFLRDVDGYNADVTVCNQIDELNRLLPNNTSKTVYSAMVMRSAYNINKLTPYSGNGIELIRVTAHEYDIVEGMEFAKIVKDKGYKLSFNPINIMGYSDEKILWLVNQVNQIQPYQFSIVDTFGSMKRRDLDRIVSLVDNNLDKNIRVALHLHENMSLSFCLAQNFIDKHLDRPVAVDGSLMGMGRMPGNLPIELIADYANDYAGKAYDIDYLMDAINDHVLQIKKKEEWGYNPVFFLSARFNLHRNYAEHLLKKGDLTNRDINHILSQLDSTKKATFDVKYADQIYEAYKNNQIDDKEAIEGLKKVLGNRDVLILAPGHTIISHQEYIEKYIETYTPIIIGANFVPMNIKIDYAFFSNSKRFSVNDIYPCKVIVTSNLTEGKADYRINYNSVSGAFCQGNNSLIMLLKLLKIIGVESISLAGADGFKSENNYYSNLMRNSIEQGANYNLAVKEALRNLDISINFITPSEYDK